MTGTGLSALLFPILLSAVAVFLVSSVLHMMTSWHKSDYPEVPNETKVRDAIRALGIPPGDYCVPRPASREEMKSGAFAEKLKQGPNFMMTMMPSGPMTMGRSLALWFLYSLGIGVFAAYVAGRALPPGSEYLAVFRFAGVTAFLGYSAALWQFSIWYHRSWMTTIKATIDGLIYALVTAGVFGWLWPR